MKIRTALTTSAVAGVCAVAGTAAGIAGGAAATSTTKGAGGPPVGNHRGAMAVHEEAVVLNKAGTGYITETEDNGTVKSVSGNEVTIAEGTTKVAYKTITVTLPSGAKISRNFKTAALSDLKAGDHVHVTQSSDGTTVMADDGTQKPPAGGRGGHPGPMGGPPPRGATGASGATGTTGATS